jgi:hypothetical protein
MGGKFRVKAEGGGHVLALPVLRPNGRRINEPPGFLIPRSVPDRAKLFLLGRLVVITDNESS